MSDLSELIERLEGALSVARAMQADLAGSAAEFPEDDMIELGVAAQIFEMEKDTLRLWCRTRRIGGKRGGRWMVSRQKLRDLRGR
ncbi:hypothetical protein NKH54_22595 [Mesorhizobium sp. M1004]|uniref:hypothetical protein n=1 Tax=Mesorhizobium sp. M1004 TaxID=2957046 RepID=UPI00333B15AA